MNEQSVIVDAKQFYEMAKDLDVENKRVKGAIKGGLQMSANIIAREARVNLKAVAYKGRGLNNLALLQKGLSVRVWKNAQGAVIGMIDNKKKAVSFKGGKFKNPAFVLRWMELGTKDRYIKKLKPAEGLKKKTSTPARRGYRGVLEGKSFFRNAVASKKQEAENTLRDNIIRALTRIANRK